MCRVWQWHTENMQGLGCSDGVRVRCGERCGECVGLSVVKLWGCKGWDMRWRSGEWGMRWLCGELGMRWQCEEWGAQWQLLTGTLALRGG